MPKAPEDASRRDSRSEGLQGMSCIVTAWHNACTGAVWSQAICYVNFPDATMNVLDCAVMRNWRSLAGFRQGMHTHAPSR